MSFQTLGKYTLVHKLAEGGMAQVWIARESGLSRLVVVKYILPVFSQNEEFRRMLIDEAKTAGQLNHANIVQIYELGRVGDSYFIAMELIDGENLTSIFQACKTQRRSIPLPIAARIMADACRGLHHAHARKNHHGRPLGIVHRDLSPQNIMVTYEGVVKVVDFGIAKATDRLSSTRVGVLKGKPKYMSPEQVRGVPLDHRSDIFSAGTLLYELCTGVPTFDADVAALLLLVSECKFPRPSVVDPEISPQLEAVILRALAPNPEDRFADANEMRLALEESAARAATSDDVGAFLRDVCREERIKQQRVLEKAHAALQPKSSKAQKRARIEKEEHESVDTLLDDWDSPTARDVEAPAHTPTEAQMWDLSTNRDVIAEEAPETERSMEAMDEEDSEEAAPTTSPLDRPVMAMFGEEVSLLKVMPDPSENPRPDSGMRLVAPSLAPNVPKPMSPPPELVATVRDQQLELPPPSLPVVVRYPAVSPPSPSPPPPPSPPPSSRPSGPHAFHDMRTRPVMARPMSATRPVIASEPVVPGPDPNEHLRSQQKQASWMMAASGAIVLATGIVFYLYSGESLALPIAFAVASALFFWASRLR